MQPFLTELIEGHPLNHLNILFAILFFSIACNIALRAPEVYLGRHENLLINRKKESENHRYPLERIILPLFTDKSGTDDVKTSSELWR